METEFTCQFEQELRRGEEFQALKVCLVIAHVPGEQPIRLRQRMSAY